MHGLLASEGSPPAREAEEEEAASPEVVAAAAKQPVLAPVVVGDEDVDVRVIVGVEQRQLLA